MSDSANETSLVERLRYMPETGRYTTYEIEMAGFLCHAAADRIEELEAENELLREKVALGELLCEEVEDLLATLQEPGNE